MDLFKFSPTTSYMSLLENGMAINKYISAMWIERYRDAGEFQIKAKLSSGLIDFLPLDTLISHTNTYEVMIVENIEIVQNKDVDPEIIISGRSYCSFFERRIAGMNQIRTNNSITEYALSAGYTWNQAVTIINDHILNTQNVNDKLPYAVAATNVTGVGENTARTIKRMDLFKAVIGLLEIDDLGIKSIRRSLFPGTLGDDIDTVFMVYKGQDKTATTVFSWERGDISGANYLWSNKTNKTSAVALGTKYNVVQDDVENYRPGRILYDRRSMIIDATDIDQNYVYDVGTINDLLAKMRVRANQAVQNQNSVSFARLDIAPRTNHIYRRDYNLGDLVMVEGNFNVRSVMRVVEHVEIVDENGRSGHPTLALPLV